MVMSYVGKQCIDENDHACHFETFLYRCEHGELKIARCV
jgi:hypothetical protein